MFCSIGDLFSEIMQSSIYRALYSNAYQVMYKHKTYRPEDKIQGIGNTTKTYKSPYVASEQIKCNNFWFKPCSHEKEHKPHFNLT
jgi:hypothetical protein